MKLLSVITLPHVGKFTEVSDEQHPLPVTLPLVSLQLLSFSLTVEKYFKEKKIE